MYVVINDFDKWLSLSLKLETKEAIEEPPGGAISRELEHNKKDQLLESKMAVWVSLREFLPVCLLVSSRLHWNSVLWQVSCYTNVRAAGETGDGAFATSR